MAKAITIYGIKNCDTMKKARAWLDEHGVAYALPRLQDRGHRRGARWKRWAQEVGWETLLNRAGTTFRKLPDADKKGSTEKKAIALMLAQPSMIKRPVLEVGGKLIVGFKPEIYAKRFRSPAAAKREPGRVAARCPRVARGFAALHPGTRSAWSSIRRCVENFRQHLASLRPVLAGTWKAWSASSKSASVARAPSSVDDRLAAGRAAPARRSCPAGRASGPATSPRCLARSSPGLPAGCSGKAKNDQAAHAGQRRQRLRLRGHAAAERFAAGEQRQLRRAPGRFGDRGAHGGVGDRRRDRAASSRAPCRETGSATWRRRAPPGPRRSPPWTCAPCRRRRHARARARRVATPARARGPTPTCRRGGGW